MDAGTPDQHYNIREGIIQAEEGADVIEFLGALLQQIDEADHLQGERVNQLGLLLQILARHIEGGLNAATAVLEASRDTAEPPPTDTETEPGS